MKRQSIAYTSLLVTALAGCGGSDKASGVAHASPKAPTSSLSPAAAQEQVFTAPDKPCDALSAPDRAKHKLTTANEDEHGHGCTWENEPGDSPPLQFRALASSYDPQPDIGKGATDYAKQDFARRKQTDFSQPNVVAGRPSVAYNLLQVGASKVNEAFDEAYYVYFVSKVADGTLGNGKVVLRKGNMIIEITADGSDVPGRRVSEGRPIASEVAQQMIDPVADQIIQAVKPGPPQP